MDLIVLSMKRYNHKYVLNAFIQYKYLDTESVYCKKILMEHIFIYNWICQAYFLIFSYFKYEENIIKV